MKPNVGKTLLPAIDGARSLACLSILLMHASVTFTSLLEFGSDNFKRYQPYAETLSRLFACSVDYFFVLAGFLMAAHILRLLQNEEFTWRDYGKLVIRRYFRLWPLMFAAMVLNHLQGTFNEGNKLLRFELKQTLMITNLNGNYISDEYELGIGPMWSCLVDFQVHCFLPLALWFFSFLIHRVRFFFSSSATRRSSVVWACYFLIFLGILIRYCLLHFYGFASNIRDLLEGVVHVNVGMGEKEYLRWIDVFGYSAPRSSMSVDRLMLSCNYVNYFYIMPWTRYGPFVIGILLFHYYSSASVAAVAAVSSPSTSSPISCVSKTNLLKHCLSIYSLWVLSSPLFMDPPDFSYSVFWFILYNLIQPVAFSFLLHRALLPSSCMYSSSILSSLLSFSPLTFLAPLCYPVYLIHWRLFFSIFFKPPFQLYLLSQQLPDPTTAAFNSSAVLSPSYRLALDTIPPHRESSFIYLFFSCFGMHPPFGDRTVAVLQCVFGVLVCIPLAWLLNKLVENPWRRWVDHIFPWTGHAAPVAAGTKKNE
eukprot:TRINITY_DN2265_c0_g1_i1.p1 TRINITY_DN2265_c0_g1~~TRINITY_DN2265_c0_g1_i1.p1  ORF type:complete len:535 (+),score=79.77 TRINITY_DN2265_c0_g1_i1:48-1652(+)